MGILNIINIKMENIDNIVQNFNISKKPKEIFKIPSSVTQYNGIDQPGLFRLNDTGNDPFTAGIVQNYDWTSTKVEYCWNSLGLRGPEPDYKKNTRILVVGGSLSLGTGIPMEFSFPHLITNYFLGSYINISDADSLSDLIDPVEKFKDFDPTIVIVSDTRFIQSHGWLLADAYHNNKDRYKFYNELLKKADKQFIKMFEYFLKNLFPNAKIVLAMCQRKSWRNVMPALTYSKFVPFTRDMVVDLARDNKHPGIASHKNFAEAIISALD